MAERGNDDNIRDAVQQLQAGRLSRRDFMRRAAVAGLSFGAIGTIIAACGDGGTQGTGSTASPAGTTGPTDQAFDPKAFEGATVRIALVDGERDEKGLQDKIPEIKERFGIDVELSTSALGALIEQNNQNLQAPESDIDIMHVLGFTVSSTVGAGLFERLNPFVETATPADYDFSDFPDGQLEYCGYYDVDNNAFGGQDLFLIPGIHSGSCLMFYRADLLEQAGLDVPTTWEEYVEAAAALHQGDVAGNAMIGANDVSLFLVDWYTRFITMGGQLMSGSPEDQTFEPNLTSDAAVRALDNMIELVQYAPDAVTSYGFTESTDAFAAGNVGMMITWSTIAGTTYDPQNSTVADAVDVAQVPADQGETPRAIRGGWGLGIPKNLPQERKDAAWHLMTYLTSKEFEQHQVLNYQTDPNRKSTFEEPELVEELPYLPAAGEAIETAQILEIAKLPEAFELIGETARTFNLALAGEMDSAQATAEAQDAWVGILKRQGYLA